MGHGFLLREVGGDTELGQNRMRSTWETQIRPRTVKMHMSKNEYILELDQTCDTQCIPRD